MVLWEKMFSLGEKKWYFEEQVAYLLLQGGVLGKKGDALGSKVTSGEKASDIRREVVVGGATV